MIVFAVGIGIIVQLAISIVVIFAFKKKADSEYGEYMQGIEYQDLATVKMLTLGMYVCTKFNFIDKTPMFIQSQYRKYQYSIKMIVRSIYGIRYEDFYFFVYSALKKVYMIYAYLFCNFLAVLLVIQKDTKNAVIIDVLGIGFALSVQFLYDSSLKSKYNKKVEQMKREFPDFVNKIVLLINAGMNITKVWQKIATEDTTNSPLMLEVKQTYFDMQNGVGEITAIDNFGRRCKVKEIMKFASVISGNLKKGGSDILPVLIEQSKECWDMRCSQAKEAGAKLSSKMVLPIMMLLVAIIIVVAGPAMFSMGGM